MNLFNNKLNRKILVDKLINYRKENNYDNNYSYFSGYIDIIEQEFLNHKFVSDSDFLIKGRRDFLVNEFYDVLKNEDDYNKKHCIDEPLYFALGNLQEILYGNNVISSIDINNDNQIIKLNERYNKKNIICLEEKQLIEKMIKDFKIFKEKNNNKFVYNEGDLIIADNQCDLCRYNNKDNVNICSKFENGKPEEILKNDTLCPFLKEKGKDPFIADDLVQKIKDMKSGAETTIALLLGDIITDYTEDELFKITDEVIETCKLENIELDFSKYANQKVGLLYNIPFVKR